MDVRALDIPGVFLLAPRRFADDRGYFCETFNATAFENAIGKHVFVQDNQSYSAAPLTVRGLHFQAPPFAQGKLVRAVRGEIFDVAIDIRKGSPHYGKWTGARLTAERGEQIFVPVGFLHGFMTLTPDTEVVYKVTAHYDKTSEGAVAWNDPKLGVDWPATDGAVLSEKDAGAQSFATFDSPFVYDEKEDAT